MGGHDVTADELAAMIAEEIDNNSSARAILAKVQRGDATLKDSERFTGITAEITGRLLADHVLSLPLSDRQGAFLDITAARYRDTFSVFSAVQRALDERLGINLAVVDPGFEKARAQKAGHALTDQTVPESTVVRRAESAGENIVRSQHDRIVQKQAEFRDRAGLSCSAIREGGAKCCEWCASVSGKYPASDTPQGFWGRHDNCKCSILYETRKGVQRLGGSAKKWEPLRDAGAPEPTRLTAEQAEKLQAEKGLTIRPRNGTINSEEKSFYSELVESGGFSYHDDGTMVVTDDWKSKGKVTIPKLYNPYAVIESVTSFRDGTVQIDRSLYNSEGVLSIQIHSADHHKPKQHPFGIHGEHHHYYTWTDGQDHPNRTTDELTDQERKEHGDLL